MDEINLPNCASFFQIFEISMINSGSPTEILSWLNQKTVGIFGTLGDIFWKIQFK